MQRLLFTTRLQGEYLRAGTKIEDGHKIHKVSSSDESDRFIILSRRREPNGKNQWNVYDAIKVDEGEAVINNGLEFRSDQEAANREFRSRLTKKEVSHE